ncbi:hypothetical protein ABZ650_20380 [Streptomyces griseoviridis]|uniref:hypothetical protein n=1 Tax=Streptomyces griseoviridis TaxID=45398 RepID=UPI0033D0E1FC
MTARRVSDALFIDCGTGYEHKTGDRAGQITYTRQPRARYECVRCGYASPVVTGPDDVKRFVATARTSHRATCPALTNQQGAAA